MTLIKVAKYLVT